MKSKTIIAGSFLGATGLATLTTLTMLNIADLSFGLYATFTFFTAALVPLIIIVADALVIGLFFVLLRITKALQIAFAGVALGLAVYTPLGLISLRDAGSVVTWMTLFGIGLVSFGVALVASRYIKSHAIAGLLAGGIVLLSAVVQVVVPGQASTSFTTRQAAGFEQALTTLDFTPYEATYHPTTMTLDKPALWGFHSALGSSAKPYVKFSVDKINVQESGLRLGQEKLVDLKNVCAISLLWESLPAAEVTEATIEAAKATPYPCTLATTTPSGKKIFIQEQKQSTYLYTRLEGTNIIFEFSKAEGQPYTHALLPEMSAVVDSLQPIEASLLDKGEY